MMTAVGQLDSRVSSEHRARKVDSVDTHTCMLTQTND